jgi:CoA:oxalate CoA-transferase
MDEFEDWSRTHSTESCLKILAENNVPAAAYRTVREAMADPQLAHRGAFQDVTDAAGTFQCLRAPFKFTDIDTEIGPMVPRLGEHTREVLSEAGLSEAEIAALA